MRYHVYVCHACGYPLYTEDNHSAAGDSCILCDSHYCVLCFVEHMLLGHTVAMERELDLFDLPEEK